MNTKTNFLACLIAAAAGATHNRERTYNFPPPPQIHRSYWPAKKGWRDVARKRRYKELVYRRHRNSRLGRN